jgi:hypothetical protein
MNIDPDFREDRFSKRIRTAPGQMSEQKYQASMDAPMLMALSPCSIRTTEVRWHPVHGKL